MASSRVGANESAAPNIIKCFVWLVVIGVVGYSEVLYLGIVGVLFPSGILYAACILGAFSNGISVLCLYAGKSHWFRPGSQLIAAWFFTGIEVVILVLNDTLAYALHNGANLDQYLSLYRFFVPAVPVIALVGWGILLFLDPSRRIRHARMEMEDKQQGLLLQFEQDKFDAQLEVQYEALKIMKQQLKSEVATNASLAHIQAGATRATSEAIAQLTGIHPLTNKLTPSTTVIQTTEPLTPIDQPSKK